jgi:hypothetical protein
MPWLAPLIVDAFEEILSVFGLGLALLIAALLADTRFALKRSLSLDRTFLRIWCGLHLMLLFAFGLLGFIWPGWEVGDVSLAEVSAGGHLGRLFAGSALGILAWVALSEEEEEEGQQTAPYVPTLDEEWSGPPQATTETADAPSP